MLHSPDASPRNPETHGYVGTKHRRPWATTGKHRRTESIRTPTRDAFSASWLRSTVVTVHSWVCSGAGGGERGGTRRTISDPVIAL